MPLRYQGCPRKERSWQRKHRISRKRLPRLQRVVVKTPTPSRPTRAPPTEIASSTANTSQQYPFTSNKEALEILRELNRNINKTNEKAESLSKRIDIMSNEMDSYENCDYDCGDNYDQDDLAAQQ